MDKQPQNEQCGQSKSGSESETPNSKSVPHPKYDSGTNALDLINDVDLKGKTALITGTNSGIGLETARTLCLCGAHIVMANRNMVASEQIRDKIMKEKVSNNSLRKIYSLRDNEISSELQPDAEIDLLNLDLSSLQSVEAAAKNYLSKDWPLHILILNAGVFGPQEKITVDGYERHFGVNHLGHFYLTYLLLPRLRESAPSRIVIVSSVSHTHTGIAPSMSTDEKLRILTALTPSYSAKFFYRLYANSKLCNILMAMKLHRMEHQNGVNTYVLHPGTMIASTGIARGFGFLAPLYNALIKPFTKSLQQGAATTVYCAVSEHLNSVGFFCIHYLLKGTLRKIPPYPCKNMVDGVQSKVIRLQESGKYYENCCDGENGLSGALAHDEALQDALWDKSVELIGKYEKNRAGN
ncbi:unnamed protein product [Anisakis simplex]|uniref:WW domain-containing oxidoreductase n=1 Tax=Anisakis simplex TaxID=6269 RepID=A0A0M3K608_ANISI|nr:unnamed protein product [Anisakis simplex]